MKKLIFSLFLFSTFWCPNALYCQTGSDLIIYRSQAPVMSSTVNSKYHLLIDLYSVNNIKFIEFNPIVSAIDSGMTLITIPFISMTPIKFETEYIRYNNDGDFQWYALTPLSDTSNDYDGSVMLISENGGKFGQVIIDGSEFIIDYLGEGVTTLIKNTIAPGEGGCGTISDSIINFNSEQSSTRTNHNCKSRILILFTAEAKASNPDIEQTARLAFEQTAQALRNSKINSSDLNIELAGIELLPNFPELSGNLFAIMTRLINNTDAETIRASTHADIVCLLANVNNTGGTLGLTVTANNTVYTDEVARFATGQNYYFAHEIGHCFSADHETCDTEDHDPVLCSDDPGIAHAHTWTWKKWFLGAQKRSSTVVFEGSAGNHVLNYSNPLVKVNKGYTGIAGHRDNASVMEQSGCTVASHDLGDIDMLYGLILGPDDACYCTSISLSANATGGSPGPYVYNWSFSFDGFNYSSIPEHDPNINFDIPCFEVHSLPAYPKGVYIRLTIQDVQLNTYTTQKLILFSGEIGDHHPCEDPINLRSISIISDPSFDIELFPNPAQDKINIIISSNSIDKVTLSIADITGKKTTLGNYEIEKGINEFNIPILTTYSGFYILMVDSDNHGIMKSKKIMINK